MAAMLPKLRSFPIRAKRLLGLFRPLEPRLNRRPGPPRWPFHIPQAPSVRAPTFLCPTTGVFLWQPARAAWRLRQNQPQPIPLLPAPLTPPAGALAESIVGCAALVGSFERLRISPARNGFFLFQQFDRLRPSAPAPLFFQVVCAVFAEIRDFLQCPRLFAAALRSR